MPHPEEGAVPLPTPITASPPCVALLADNSSTDSVGFSTSAESLARAISDPGEYRVLRRFRPRRRYADRDGASMRLALFVDVETTGLDAAHDRIIEFAAVPFQYDPADGRVYELHEAITYLEDPGSPIPPHVTELTGINDAMVRDRRIADDRVNALVASASLIIAHNAAFDRAFLERRSPIFARKPWACSHVEVPWATYGLHGTKLEFLLFKHCGEFFEAHRAVDDCLAGIHVLATPFACGTLPLRLLLESARSTTVRVWARDTAFQYRDPLKARGYRWHPGDARSEKSWYRECAPHETSAECAWLEANIYTGRAPAWELESLTAFERYSWRR